MSYFNDHGVDADQGGEFESGGAFEPIPDNTRLLAYIEDVGIDESQFVNGEFIDIRWKVHEPEEYKNRVIFHKLKIEDPKKAPNAWKMLAAIDANAGGEIAKLSPGTRLNGDILTDALTNKPMVITVRVWEIGNKSGNWVCAVAPRSAGTEPGQAGEKSKKDDLGADDVPF